jgi:hypothetical protein
VKHPTDVWRTGWLLQGPRILKMVRTPSSRTGVTFFHRCGGWCKIRKPTPSVSM